jgi:uncharacterized membrane protein YoaK (UPF0700 family)
MLPADVWLAYVLGAVLTGAIVLRWPSFAVLPPVIVLAAVAVVATAREYIATSSSQYPSRIHSDFIAILIIEVTRNPLCRNYAGKELDREA